MLSRSHQFLGLAVLFLALLACKRSKTERAQPSAQPTPTVASEETASAAPEPTARPAPKPDVDERGVPAIPADRSDPPKGSEWENGIAVNTQGAGSQAKDCTLRILREWLQVTCRGSVTGYEKLSGFGTKNQDYFESFVNGQHGSFVVRLKKGRYPKVRICRGGNYASLFVSWPAAAERPKHVALAQIPKRCGS